jgi:hypothetical protein
MKTPDVPYRLATTYQIATAIYPPVPVPQPTDTTTRTRFLTVSTAIGFHPSPRGRVRPAYFAGFSLVRASYKSSYFNYIVPLGSTIAVPPTGMPVPTYYPPPPRTTVKQTTNTSAAVLGFEAAIGLGQHLAVVPEIRALTLSFQGDGVFLIRPGVGVRWSF